jgi:hypothetical protein
MALSAAISRMVPILRNQGGATPNLIPLSLWCDAVVLLTTVAQTYALKTDSLSLKGTILRITSQAAVFVNAKGTTAAAPGSTTTDGSSPILLNSHLRPVLLQLPVGSTTLSLVNAVSGTNIVTIEAWD